MGSEGCYKCMKYTLAVFNLLVMAIGATVLALGIYTLVTDFGVTRMTAILGSEVYRAGVYLLIIGGSVTVLISFLGCCGAFFESRVLLGLYFAVMLVLTIFFIVITICGFIFKNNVTDTLKAEAERTLVQEYGVENDVTERWDEIQQDLKCCGVSGDVGSNTSWAIYKLDSKWFRDQPSGGYESRGTMYVPKSCCDLNNNLMECLGIFNTATDKPPFAGPPLTNPVQNDALYTDGCYDILDDFLESNALIIAGIALASIFIMVLGVVFSMCVWVQIGRDGYIV